MKRFLLFLVVASLAAPASAQLFNAPMTPTTPGASMTLGAGLPAALANPANSNGGVSLLGGSVTSGDCLIWGANGIQDAGSACATTNVTGMGAPVATSLSNRATDFGVTFNLKTDFGARCDGATDDTAAIQSWLSKAASGVHLVAPAGACLFSAPLTIAPVNAWTMTGAGVGTTIFTYTGTDYNGTVTAGASWSAAATSITLASATLPTNVAAAYAAGYAISVYDTTSGRFVGAVSTISGTTLTLAAGAVYASTGSGDALHLTTDLITFGVPTGGGHGRITLSDFSVVSNTALTGGFALHVHGLFDGVVSNVFADDVNSVAANAGNLCGGFWFDGGANIEAPNLSAYSLQNCGDGVLINAAQGGGAGLSIRGGFIGGKTISSVVQGFTNGVHMAGGWGGFWCTDSGIHGNGNGVLIDNALAAVGNREFNVGSTCSLDTNQNSGLTVNDTIASGGTVDMDGWEASALTGHGVVVQSWINGDVEIRGNKIYNNCGSGVYVADVTTHVFIAPGEAINNNGNTGLGAPCAVWQSSGQPGYGSGYGIQAASATSNILSFASPYSNTAGQSNALAGLLTPTFVSYTNLDTMWLTSPVSTTAKLIVNTTSSSQLAALAFANAGTLLWQEGVDTNAHFHIWDVAASSALLLDCATGGSCTLGETSSSLLTLSGGLTAANGTVTLGSLSATAPTIPMVLTGVGYNAWTEYQVSGTSGWRVGQEGSEGGGPFVVYDLSASHDAIQLKTGGNTVLGSEGTSTITQITGALGAGGATAVPTASGTCAVGTLLGGQIAGSFKASTACSSGTVILTFAATQPNGYVCEAQDETTSADVLKQTAHSATSVTFTGTMASGDNVVWKCFGF